jgi:hypothetical protein
MGIVDTIWGNASPENVAIGTAAGISLYYIWFRVDEHIRLRRLGKPGPTLHHKLPLGETQTTCTASMIILAKSEQASILLCAVFDTPYPTQILSSGEM